MSRKAVVKTRATVTVDVTAEDIADGVHGYSFSCPIALALRGIGYYRVEVGPNCVTFDQFQTVQIPEIARKFIADFDADLPVKPFSFDIDVPVRKRP